MKKLFLVLSFLCVPMMALAATGKATIKGTAPDSTISGEATLTEKDGGIEVEVQVANAPVGKHGFHIHENGSCEDMGKAAGGHFNPEKVDHGFLPKDGHQHAHVGDMGSIDIDQDGKGTLKLFMPGLTLAQGTYAVVNKAIILHENVDDFSQPTGNAGGRIACGIIESTNAEGASIQSNKNQAIVYTCPMHPEVRQSMPGTCPKCGMALEVSK
ncbi:MAG: superoxide dismutase family protein [Candidatus Omnitrophica bacterium]|nr:superoxide dismutase family protein [Candidatus Omnitrophota bacterium]